MIIVWRITGNFIRAVLCCIVWAATTIVHNGMYTLTREQFLQMTTVGLGLTL